MRKVYKKLTEDSDNTYILQTIHKVFTTTQGGYKMDEYIKQGIDFLKETGTTFKAKYIKNGLYFADDKEERAIFGITLKNSKGSYSFKFGQSIAEGNKEPSAYDVLACLTKYEPSSFKYFCNEFGYDSDSIKALKTYKAVIKEWEGLNRIFDCMQIEKLREIQ